MRIGAEPESRLDSLGDNLGAGAGDCSEQPVQATFARDELDSPNVVLADEFVVPLGDAEDFVHRLDPFPSYSLLSEQSGERFAQRYNEAPGLYEKRFGSLRVDLGQAQKLGASFSGDNARRVQEMDKPFPG